MAGITDAGFTQKTLPEIKAAIEARLKSLFGDDIDLDNSGSTVTRILGVIYPEIDELWSSLQLAYDVNDIDSASAVGLDRIGARVGNTRKAATFSTVNVDITGTEGTVIPIGLIRTVSGTGARFKADNIETTYTIPAGLTVTVPFKAETAGAVIAAAGTITEGASVTGIDSTTNPLDATVGNAIETDAVYRARIKSDLAAQGNATIPAIRANVLNIATVTAVSVFENASHITDGDGRPPHSFQAFIQSSPPTGDEVEIRETIFESKPAGIQSFGTDTGTHTDTDGQVYQIDFERTATVDIYVKIDLNTTDSDFPGDGITQIKDAIAAFGLTLEIGGDVVFSYVLASYISSIPGIVDHDLYIKSGSAPTGIPGEQVNIAITALQIASFDTANMVVA